MFSMSPSVTLVRGSEAQNVMAVPILWESLTETIFAQSQGRLWHIPLYEAILHALPNLS